MPKLKSVHLSRVGHPSARLDGVSIYFTAKGNPSGKPERSTILALRNGGGKTSLLQLLFSTFVPDKREFSGRTSEGGERTFDQYFQPNDLGMIVTEWDLGEGMPTRVVGQCVVKVNVSDTNPQQCFFSFLVTDQNSDFQVSDLPMRQFKSQKNLGNASSFSAFKQLLRSAFVMLPHQQFMITETQKEWLRSLRSWGYEPDLFRLLILLNKSEGGSKEMAKNNFGTTEKMIGLVAMLSMSEQDRKKGKYPGNIHDLISKYREDLSHLPEKEAEKKMWEQLSGALTGLIEPGQDLVQAQHKKNEAFLRLTVVGREVIATPVVLQGKISAKNDEVSLLEDFKKDKSERIRRLEKEQYWIDKEILRLTLATAKETFEEAEEIRNTSSQYYSALGAHNIKTAIRSLNNQRQGLLASISEATEPTRDIEDTLHALGNSLNVLLKGQLTEAGTRKNDADERFSRAENLLATLRKEENTRNVAFGQVTNLISNLEKWFERVEKERSDLDLGNRSAAEALDEFDKQRHEDESTLSLLQEEARQLNEQKMLLYGVQKVAAADLKTAGKNQKQHEERQEAFKEAYKKVAFDGDLCLLIEDEEIDPYSPGLPGLLNEKQTRLEKEKFNLSIEQRRCRESLNFLEGEYKLMPPPEDVWCVCEALKNVDIQAYPYVKYLSEINLDPARIRELLTQDPARYGGVCIVNSKDMQKTMDIVGELGSLRGPVQVYPLDKHISETTSSSITESGVALPLTDATFNQSEAAAEHRKLRHEISDRDNAIDEIEQHIVLIKTSSNQLNMFLNRYPDGTRSDLNLEKQRLDSLVESLTENLAVATRNFVDHGSVVAENAQKQTDMQEKVEIGRTICRNLQNYITNFESMIPAKETELQKFRIELESLKSRLAAIGQETEKQGRLKQKAEYDRTAIQKIVEDLTDRKEALDYTDALRGQIPSGVNTEDLDSLQSFYDSLKKTYEEKNKNIEALVARVESLKDRIAEKVKELGKYQIATIPEFVFDEIVNQYGENTIDDSVLRSASNDFEDNKKKATLAENAVENSRSELENFPYPPTELLEPENAQLLTTIEACTARKTDSAKEIGKLKNDREAFIEKINSLKWNIDSLQKEFGYIDSLIKIVKGKTPEAVEQAITLSGYDNYKEALNEWSVADQAHNEAVALEELKLDTVKKMKAAVYQILGDERFSKIAIIIRQRINSQMETLHLDAADFAQEAQNALDSVEYTLSKAKDQQKEIVDYLLDDVRTVKSNLDALDRISKIPETDTKWAKWSGRRFFKVKIEGKRLEDDYCRTKIEEYVRKLVKGNEKSFPTCAQDIIEGVAKFALKDITTITTMKPDHFMSTNPETLDGAARWSGGEGFTYAALSLMIFNQLICHINASVNLAGGILVVDNPIGICNHLEFIKLQQIMANILENQLIYPTAVKDFDALSLFPNVVTLSNNRVDAKTGFKHVRVESHTHNVPEVMATHMTFSTEVVNVHAGTV